MDLNSSKDFKKNNGGLLKTTTWGALIALSLVLTLLGFTGYLFHFSGNSPAPQPATRIASAEVPVSPEAAKPARSTGFLSNALSQAAKLIPFPEERKDTSVATQVSPSTDNTPILNASTSASSRDESGAKQEPESSAASQGVEDFEALAAAKIAPDLKGIDPEKPVDVIVQLNGSLNASDLEADGATIKADLPAARAELVTMKAGTLSSLASRPSVVYISPDRQVAGALDNTAAAVNAPAAWAQGLNGTGIGVAVIDSGIAWHNLLENASGTQRVVYSQDFTGDGYTQDPYGHGTHVAGIIGANSPVPLLGYTGGRNLQGIASGVTFINLRALNYAGTGTDSMVIAAIQEAIALKSKYNIRVINLSLGRPVSESYTLDPLDQAVEQAWKSGIVVVVAAGNYGRLNNGGIDGYGTITAPGNDPYVITVGAMKTEGTPQRTDDLIASYSSKGPTLYDHVVKPDIVAPGNLVVSLCTAPADDSGVSLWDTYASTHILTTYYDPAAYPGLDTWFYQISGTSMATPVVSGAAAILLQQHPTLTPDQVKARLMKTAYKSFPATSTATDPTTGITYTSQYDVFTVGAGYLDIGAAIANTDVVGTKYTAMSPTVKFNASTDTVALVNGSSVVWGTSSVWSSSVVWGTSVISGTNPSGQSVLWGSSVVWGSSSTQGYSVVWGTGTGGTVNPSSVVWGTASQQTASSMAVLTLGEK